MLLAPLQIPLHLLYILESSLHSGPRFRKTSLCFCAQLFNLALLVVKFAGSVILSVMGSSIAAINYQSPITFPRANESKMLNSHWKLKGGGFANGGVMRGNAPGPPKENSNSRLCLGRQTAIQRKWVKVHIRESLADVFLEIDSVR